MNKQIVENTVKHAETVIDHFRSLKLAESDAVRLTCAVLQSAAMGSMVEAIDAIVWETK